MFLQSLKKKKKKRRQFADDLQPLHTNGSVVYGHSANQIAAFALVFKQNQSTNYNYVFLLNCALWLVNLKNLPQTFKK